jgi:hypothetical protein
VVVKVLPPIVIITVAAAVSILLTQKPLICLNVPIAGLAKTTTGVIPVVFPKELPSPTKPSELVVS